MKPGPNTITGVLMYLRRVQGVCFVLVGRDSISLSPVPKHPKRRVLASADEAHAVQSSTVAPRPRGTGMALSARWMVRVVYCVGCGGGCCLRPHSTAARRCAEYTEPMVRARAIPSRATPSAPTFAAPGAQGREERAAILAQLLC